MTSPPRWVICDSIIECVFSGRISNTIQHGQFAAEIRACRQTPEGPTIVYEDNGAGIAADRRSRIFTDELARISEFSFVFIPDLSDLSGLGIRETGETGKGARFEITVPKGMYRIGSQNT